MRLGHIFWKDDSNVPWIYEIAAPKSVKKKGCAINLVRAKINGIKPNKVGFNCKSNTTEIKKSDLNIDIDIDDDLIDAQNIPYNYVLAWIPTETDDTDDDYDDADNILTRDWRQPWRYEFIWNFFYIFYNRYFYLYFLSMIVNK